MVKTSPPVFADILSDAHIHTRLCGHATGEMEEYVQAAIRKGLTKITFLEHMEEGILHFQGKTWLSEDDFDSYFSEGERLQISYQNEIEIGLGVECGYNPDCCGQLNTRLQKRAWSQIGISCHFLKFAGMDNHLNLFSRKEKNILLAREIGDEKILTRYFTTLIEAVDCLPGSMLCHLDGALRFLPEISLTKAHYELIDKLLLRVKHNKLAIEINTSGLAIRQEQFPSRRILSMARDYNIPFVFSSDAHKPDDVGRFFDIVNATLLSEFYP